MSVCKLIAEPTAESIQRTAAWHYDAAERIGGAEGSRHFRIASRLFIIAHLVRKAQ